jgi:predicted adenylyl cyclase CyaB
MARNIEIKARISNMDETCDRVRRIADQGPMEISQDDTFFPCPNGRLKLRELSPAEGQLIFYKREDKQGPKESFYVISQTGSPDSLRKVLSLAWGELGRVRKRRTLYMIGRTRVHLDRVDGLGDFLELEVVLAEEEQPETGVKIAYDLLEKLEISPSQLIDEAYIDLLFHP